MPKEDLSWLDRGGEMMLVSLSVLRDLATAFSEAPVARADSATVSRLEPVQPGDALPLVADAEPPDDGGDTEVIERITAIIDRLANRLGAFERARLRGANDVKPLYQASPQSTPLSVSGIVPAPLIANNGVPYRGAGLLVASVPKGSQWEVTLSDQPNSRRSRQQMQTPERMGLVQPLRQIERELVPR
jgi:hypothetical protein